MAHLSLTDGTIIAFGLLFLFLFLKPLFSTKIRHTKTSTQKKSIEEPIENAVSPTNDEPELPEAQKNHSFAQLNWNLPGFQSLLRPFTGKLSADQFSPWEHFYNDFPKQNFSDQLTSYSFPYSIEMTMNIDSFFRFMLNSLAERLGPGCASVCLRNQQGDYYLVLQHSGSLFVREKNTKLSSSAWQKIISSIEMGNYVSLRDGEELAFPLPTRFGPLGLLHFRRESPLTNPQILEEIWPEIRKYGENLFQACIYEQACTDQQSTLYNGMRFQEELIHEMDSRLQKTVPTQLILVQFTKNYDDTAVPLCGKAIRHCFAAPARAFRIGYPLYSVLAASDLDLTEIRKKLLELVSLVQTKYAIELQVGSAILSSDLNSPQAWFEAAKSSLVSEPLTYSS